MPGGDRTGPRGVGPLSGRQLGYCADYDRPGYANFAPGYGRGGGYGFRNRGGMGFGRGFGFRGGYGGYAPPRRYDEPEVTERERREYEDEIRGLKEVISSLKDRIDKLEKK